MWSEFFHLTALPLPLVVHHTHSYSATYYYIAQAHKWHHQPFSDGSQHFPRIPCWHMQLYLFNNGGMVSDLSPSWLHWHLSLASVWQPLSVESTQCPDSGHWWMTPVSPLASSQPLHTHQLIPHPSINILHMFVPPTQFQACFNCQLEEGRDVVYWCIYAVL